MRAMIHDESGTLHWREVPDPVPAAGEVLIDVGCAAVNRADLLQRQGLYPPPPGAPEWMGLEVSGTIAAFGSVVAAEGRWSLGDRVCALLPGGGYAERVTSDARLLLPIPDGLGMEEAASLPEVFATAHLNLFGEAGLLAGERVLVQAGASGVGIAAIQLAKAAGAEVVTTVGGPDKVAAVKALGADQVIDRLTEDYVDALARCAGDGRAVAVVLDCVGGEAMGRALEHLAPGGRWIVIATLAGTETQLPLRVVLKRGLRIIGSTLRSRSLDQKAAIIRALRDEVWPRLADGTIRPVVHACFDMADTEAAHRVLEERTNVGKVVLRVGARSS